MYHSFKKYIRDVNDDYIIVPRLKPQTRKQNVRNPRYASGKKKKKNLIRLQRHSLELKYHRNKWKTSAYAADTLYCAHPIGRDKRKYENETYERKNASNASTRRAPDKK